MPLAPGDRLGPYEILEPLGRGGMGEVWKARDPRLGRQVAIKVLPDTLTDDPVATARFEREARAVAALAHPNILALYDVGRSEGLAYVVTELLEGQSLRARLQLGRIGVREAASVARQVAEGLAAAHERGIVHRDLKPANLWLLPDGRVKILDFGLAKPAAVHGELDPLQQPTIDLQEAPATSSGTIVGTVGYMSPEQVRGLPVDARSDLFSLGVVLWEMVTGRRPFQGDTAMDTLTAILKEEPPELDPAIGIPPGLARTLEHCLRKDPKQRFQTARDLAFALGDSASSTRGAPSVRTRLRPRSRAMAVGAAALVATGILGAVVAWRFRPAPSRTSFQRATFTQGAIRAARFTGDGRTILYSARFEGESPGLYLTRSGSAEARRLEVGERELLAISRREELALLTVTEELPEIHIRSGKLEVVGLSGGDALAIADNVIAADWFPDGSKLAIVRHLDGEFRIEAPPGRVVASGRERLSNLRVAPDGTSLAAFRFDEATGSEAALVRIDLASGEQKVLVPLLVTLGGLCWHPSGETIWYTTFGDPSGDLHAADLDGRIRVLLDLPDDLEIQDLSPGGEILALNGTARTFVLRQDRSGSPAARLTRFRWGWAVSMSRDGSAAVVVEDPLAYESAPYLTLHRTGQLPRRLPPASEAISLLSGDGRAMLVAKWEKPLTSIEVQTLDGEVLHRLAAPEGLDILPIALQADGLIAVQRRKGSDWAVIRSPLSGTAWTEIAPIEIFGPQYLFVDPSESSLLYRTNLRDYRILNLSPGSEPAPVRGLEPGERVFGWTADGRSVWVGTTKPAPVSLERLELATGRREEGRTLEFPGVRFDGLGDVRVSLDGTVAVATAMENQNALFVISGVR